MIWFINLITTNFLNDIMPFPATTIIYRGLTAKERITQEELQRTGCSFFQRSVIPHRHSVVRNLDPSLYLNDKFFSKNSAKVVTVDDIRKLIDENFDDIKEYVLCAMNRQVNLNDQCIAVPCTSNEAVARHFAFGDTKDNIGHWKPGLGNGWVLCMQVPSHMLINTKLYYFSAFRRDDEDEVLFPIQINQAHIKEVHVFRNHTLVNIIQNTNFDPNLPMFNEIDDELIALFCESSNQILDDDYNRSCAEGPASDYGLNDSHSACIPDAIDTYSQPKLSKEKKIYQSSYSCQFFKPLTLGEEMEAMRKEERSQQSKGMKK
jgi:hypothetical protein